LIELERIKERENTHISISLFSFATALLSALYYYFLSSKTIYGTKINLFLLIDKYQFCFIVLSAVGFNYNSSNTCVGVLI
jgi:hypothetical protein